MIDLLSIDELIFSKVVKEFPMSTYGLSEINFTSKDTSNSANLIFPNIYIHCVGGSEKSQTLENDELNGRQLTFEVMVKDNNDDEIIKSISKEIIKIFKGMMFDVMVFPVYSTLLDVYTSNMRFRCTFDTDENFSY